MLPTIHTETPQEAAERQANFIVLRTLESKLPKEVFESVVKNIQQSIELPKRVDWKGVKKDLSYDELKVNFSQVDQNFLSQLLESEVRRHSNPQSNKLNSNDRFQITNSQWSSVVAGKQRNLHISLDQLHLSNFVTDQKKCLINHQISRYERMKTVFGHALIEEGYNAPIYNVKFDQTGSYIISGADDGIIKIWDKDTLNLQAALHSHEDVITDLDISKCNQYLATASKDGKVIIWDWKKCVKLDEIQAHNGTVNNIKFFALKIKNPQIQQQQSEEIQILVTCSEDGTIKIYDEIAYLQQQQSVQDNQSRRSRAREAANNHRRQRYYETLTPEDYRPGAKNKKIDSIHLNQNGLLAAGSDKGDIYLWEIDVKAFKKQQPKAIKWLGSAKKHSKTVHLSDFSPNGKFLFTGSVDGTAKIWNVEKDKIKKNDSHNSVLALTDDRLVVTLEEKRSNWQCDSITWSAYGRYAMAALSGKVEDDQNKEYSIIKVWDSCTGCIINDIAKGNNIQLMNYSFVLTAHPKIDEIFLSGSDGGLICLWNIKTRQLIKKFLEYGIYSFEKYTMNDPYDGRFSPDGSSFVVGSVMGTLSLFSCDGAAYKYQATRVEQFYPQDNTKHNINIYYEDQNQIEPSICGYSLIPFEVQPPSSHLGKFKHARKMTTEEYERNLMIRRELCQEEENFIQGQLEEGMRNDLFNPDNERGLNFNVGDDLYGEEEIEVRRGNGRNRINSQLSQIVQNNNNHAASQEDVEILNGINNAERRRPERGRRQNIVNRVNRQIMNPNFDPENDAYDRESDENFELSRDVDSDIVEEEDESSQEDDESEEYYGHHHKSNRTVQQTRSNRLNVRQTANQILRQQDRQNREDSRNLRALRRQTRQQVDDHEEEKLGAGRSSRVRTKKQGTRGSRRRALIDESEESADQDSEEYEMSDLEKNQNSNKRRLVRNNARSETIRSLPSSDDTSNKSESHTNNIQNEDGDDDSEFGNRRKTRGRPSKKKTQQNQPANRRGLRSRNNRKNYEGMDESSDDYQVEESEEEKIQQSKSQEEEKLGASTRSRKAVIEDDSDEEMEYDGDVQLPQDSKNKKQLKGDEDWELVDHFQQADVANGGENAGDLANNNQQVQLEEDMILQDHNRNCSFCLRVDAPLIGPFIKYGKNKQVVDGPKYFHKDCIEVNNYSFFSKQKNKWLNIGKALEQFTKKPCMCHRCGQIGATIKCQDCYKHYHGHLCSQLYMLFIDRQQYQCFECRNKINFRMLKDKESLLDKQELKIIKRSIDRDYLLAVKQTLKTYIPQVGDEVYYFFQGHERFISYYNCFFYCGDEESLPFDYPWKLHPDQLEKPTLCKIIKMKHRFPSKNALHLIKKYGKQSNCKQIPQIITYLELEIVDQNDDEQRQFSLDLFPNELPDFLVLKQVYEKSLVKYQSLLEENKLENQVFKARCKNFNKVRVVDILQREPTFFPDTNWETILYRHEDAYRLRDRGRRGRREAEELEPPEIMNFWELNLSSNPDENQDDPELVKEAFDGTDKERIINLIEDFCEKKRDEIDPFIRRVTDQIAPDYRQHITAEMYLNLIKERIINGFYRHEEQLYFDLELICKNSELYNGLDNVLSQDAKKLTEKLKKEIKNILNYSGLEENKRVRQEETKISINLSKPAGKLTAPSRFDANTTSMDLFKKAQEEQQQQKRQQDNSRRQNQYQEEIKIGTHPQKDSKNKKQPVRYEQSDTIMSDINVQLDNSIEDSSEFKITPKAPVVFNNSNTNSGSRRLTRQNGRGQTSTNQHILDTMTAAFSTDEKPDYYYPGVGNDALQDPSNQNGQDAANNEHLLGKRTRSGRNTKVIKQSLCEDENEDEFEDMIGTSRQNLTGARKRLRNH